MIFGLLPKEEAFFDLFKQAAHNVIEGSRLLKELMEDYTNVQQKIERIKEVEHIGDGITHDIALRLNQTFLTPLDREDIHDLASALDDILDAVEAVADRFAIYKIAQPSDSAIRLGDILHRASLAVGRGVDHIAMSHEEVKEYGVQVNSLENEADRVSRDAISELFEKERNPIAVIKWKEIYETFEEGTDRCEDVANVIERIVLKQT